MKFVEKINSATQGSSKYDKYFEKILKNNMKIERRSVRENYSLRRLISRRGTDDLDYITGRRVTR